MKKKYFILAATAITMMVSCADEKFVGDENLLGAGNGEEAIGFNLNVPAMTRADATGATAAEHLSNQFIVYAEKDETADGAAPVTDGSSTHQLVFQNYKVAWTSNSAYTTTSNTKNWEYVGLQWSSDENSHITTSTTDAQTIKYWDWGADSYTFTAVSAKPTDISSGYVTITKTTEATTGNKVYDKGYTAVLTANADLDKLYFSERNFIERSTNATNTDRNAVNLYGGNVTLRFHNMASKVRVAMYENIPGHTVTINKFLVDNDGGATPAFTNMTDNVTANFAANFQNCAKGTAGTLTVKYNNSGTTVNHPTVSFSGTAADVLALGTQLKENVTIGTSTTLATYDKAEKAYTSVFPKEDNEQNLKLKVCYTLTAPVTGETITVEDATAEIPAEYLKWKPGYAYTYIFKISDNTNGYTGPNTSPAGLYPITFDAVETVDADGLAEYITTVSEPTITTFGYDATNKKFVTGGSEYAAGYDIYATFTEGSSVKTPVLGTYGEYHVNIFKVTTPDATNFPITEASVAEAIANPARITNAVWTCAVTDVTSKAATDLTNEGTYYKKDANNKAPGDAGYIVTPAVKSTDYTIGATAAENTIAEGVSIYTCTVAYTTVASAADLTTGTIYYKSDGSHDPGTTGYVPTVAATGTDYQVAPKVAATDITSSTSTDYFTGGTAPSVVATVPGEDGVNKTINAVKLTGVKTGTYAIEYEASAAWTGDYKKVYKVIVVQ